MQQSSVIFFFLLAAFVVFITQKGELPAYMGLLFLSPPQQPSTTQTSSNDDLAKAASTLIQYAPEAIALA